MDQLVITQEITTTKHSTIKLCENSYHTLYTQVDTLNATDSIEFRCYLAILIENINNKQFSWSPAWWAFTKWQPPTIYIVYLYS